LSNWFVYIVYNGTNRSNIACRITQEEDKVTVGDKCGASTTAIVGDDGSWCGELTQTSGHIDGCPGCRGIDDFGTGCITANPINFARHISDIACHILDLSNKQSVS
jgi:hypothetical protein